MIYIFKLSYNILTGLTRVPDNFFYISFVKLIDDIFMNFYLQTSQWHSLILKTWIICFPSTTPFANHFLGFYGYIQDKTHNINIYLNIT